MSKKYWLLSGIIACGLFLLAADSTYVTCLGDVHLRYKDWPVEHVEVECSHAEGDSEFYFCNAPQVVVKWLGLGIPQGSGAWKVSCEEVTLNPPTQTTTPPPTPTPITITWTVTPTQSRTPTPTRTPTPITPTPTLTTTPKPNCGLIELESSQVGEYAEGYYAVVMRIRNDNPVPVYLDEAFVDWTKDIPERELWAMQFEVYEWVLMDDLDPPTTWIPSPPVELASLEVKEFIALFKPVAEPLLGEGTARLTFENHCDKTIRWSVPTITPTLTSTTWTGTGTPIPSLTNTPTNTISPPTPTNVPNFRLNVDNYFIQYILCPDGRYFAEFQVHNWEDSTVPLESYGFSLMLNRSTGIDVVDPGLFSNNWGRFESCQLIEDIPVLLPGDDGYMYGVIGSQDPSNHDILFNFELYQGDDQSGQYINKVFNIDPDDPPPDWRTPTVVP